MFEQRLTVASEALEEVLDGVLPLAPLGVHELADGDTVELAVRGERAQLPSRAALAAAAGAHLLALREREVSDDWRERQRADWRPELVGGRLVVRPAWAPDAPLGDGVIEIVLAESAAFGAGTHPTTRACLELMLDLAPNGAFADLGCGTGLLAITAARLGFATVTAVDRDPGSVAAARANARLNGVSIATREADLAAAPPPPAETVVANVPASVHVALAGRFAEPPLELIAGGMVAEEVDAVLDAYARHGLRERRRLAAAEWQIVLLSSAGYAAESPPRR